MGMYDYVGGEQIKIFRTPHVYDEEVVYSGGSLLSFGDDDELPLKTLYYQYPNDFVVYDYRFIHKEEFDYIWIFKNRKFSHFKKLDTLMDEDLVGPIYDYFGSLLNVKTIEDFSSIHVESELARAKDKELELSIFPEGFFETLRNNYALYQEKEKEWEKKSHQHFRAFKDKWFAKNPFHLEETFGATIDCYMEAKNNLDMESDEHFNPVERYVEVIVYMQSFIKKNPNITESYRNWLDDDQRLEEIGYNEILSEISNYQKK